MTRAHTRLERVRGVLREGHKGAAVEVPFDPAERWGIAAIPLRTGRRGHRVVATIGSVTFETTIVARARRHFVLIDAATCAAAAVAPGDEVALTVQPID
jgi:hypothetical protein